jgi:hypothetical protein
MEIHAQGNITVEEYAFIDEDRDSWAIIITR